MGNQDNKDRCYACDFTIRYLVFSTQHVSINIFLTFRYRSKNLISVVRDELIEGLLVMLYNFANTSGTQHIP